MKYLLKTEITEQKPGGQKVAAQLDLEAESMEEVLEKVQCFSELTDPENLEHEDLLQATDVIVDHPEVVEFIKDVAPPEGQKLGWTDYLKIARKAFQKFG